MCAHWPHGVESKQIANCVKYRIYLYVVYIYMKMMEIVIIMTWSSNNFFGEYKHTHTHVGGFSCLTECMFKINVILLLWLMIIICVCVSTLNSQLYPYSQCFPIFFEENSINFAPILVVTLTLIYITFMYHFH